MTYTKRQEESVEDSKTSNAVRLGEPIWTHQTHQQATYHQAKCYLQVVATRKNKTEDGLHAQTEDHTVFGTEIVNDESTKEGTGLQQLSARFES